MRGGGVILLALALAGCPPPGKGPKAELGYRRSEAVIGALEAYRQARGAYPDSLPQLVPAFAADSMLRAPVQTYPYEYRRTEDGYTLRFRYSGPGMNYCTWTPKARAWDCGGYF